MRLPLIARIGTSLSELEARPRGRFDDLVREAFVANDVDALSMLLSLPNAAVVEDVKALLRRSITNDAVECALYLLTFLEEERRAREEAWRQHNPRNTEQEFVKIEKKGKRGRQELRDEYIQEREQHCGRAPTSRELLVLAREAMARKPAPAVRCARAFLLHAHRLRKQRPRVGQPLLGTDELPLRDAEGHVGIPYPPTPTDLPAALLPNPGARGGLDLSLGGAAVPLQWVNAVDDAEPPPIVYVRKCIDVDVRPDYRRFPAKPCDGIFERKAVDRQGDRFVNAGRTLATGLCPCAPATFPSGKPGDGFCECSWACAAAGSCSAHCGRRVMQTGSSCRLQVFRHPFKGWCLRTLTFIPDGSFVMECVL